MTKNDSHQRVLGLVAFHPKFEGPKSRFREFEFVRRFCLSFATLT